MDRARRGPLAFYGHVEGVQRDLGVQCLAHGPADDLAGVYVEDGGEMEAAFARWDVGEVGESDMTGGRRLEVSGQSVGRDWIAVAAVRRPGSTRQGRQAPQAGAAHEPLHAGSTDPTPMPPQSGVLLPSRL